MGCGVDDAGLLGCGNLIEERLPLVPFVVEPVYAEPDVGSVEAANDDPRLPKVEPLHDLLTHQWRGGGREGEHAWVPEFLDEGAEAEVVRPEVVAPLDEAVGLIDDEERRPDLPQPLQG